MNDIYRIFKCQNGCLEQLVFIKSEKAVFEYLESCYKHNTDENTFILLQRLKLNNKVTNLTGYTNNLR